jgi:hypothetical protein
MSRHKSLQSSMRYQEPNHEMYQNYTKAILGKHVARPPRRSRAKKKVNRKSPPQASDSEAEFDDNNNFLNDDPMEPSFENLKRKKPATISSSSSMMD